MNRTGIRKELEEWRKRTVTDGRDICDAEVWKDNSDLFHNKDMGCQMGQNAIKPNTSYL